MHKCARSSCLAWTGKVAHEVALAKSLGVKAVQALAIKALALPIEALATCVKSFAVSKSSKSFAISEGLTNITSETAQPKLQLVLPFD